jgi:Bacterial protein of unknown function (DUF882)
LVSHANRLEKGLRFPTATAVLLTFLSGQPVSAQGFFDLFKQPPSNSYAPSEDGKVSIPPPLSIIPISPKAGGVSKAGTKVAAPAKIEKKTEEEDEDDDTLFEHEKPKAVKMALPPARPGGVTRTAQEVAPVGAAKWSNATEKLPPGVDFRGAVTLPSQPSRIEPTRLASLPGTQSTPRWSMTDGALVRPQGLRESEVPVANMPGVYAPPEAHFQCLPDGIKQVLMDTAKRFGHVAILNAKRREGTGARGSYHYRCRAVDFRVRGVAVSTVYAYLKQHPNVGGRKIYPFGFFHVDDGPSRSW